MRESSLRDCRDLLRSFGLEGPGSAIDVGGTESVFLENRFAPNPLRQLHPGITFLDGGFNVEALTTRADQVADFLDPAAISHLDAQFDYVHSFDTLEHVRDPTRFCQHLIRVAKPGGVIHVATVFEWGYHPSPQDYWRFSPTGLLELFTSSSNAMSHQFQVLWFGWGSDPRGVALIGRRLHPGELPVPVDTLEPGSLSAEPDRGLPLESRLRRKIGRWRRLRGPERRAAIQRVLYWAGGRFLVRPVRQPSGFWMVAWPDVLGLYLRQGRFEPAESRFVERFLQPGMNVVDVGAHQGYYSLLAARRVGPTGRVYAFEPSPAMRRRLRWNLRLNRATNIQIERFALGDQVQQGKLYVVPGRESGCSSLRPPTGAKRVIAIRARVETLDGYLGARPVGGVIHFLKMDVEGGELAVVQGARELLTRDRPVVLCELSDARTAAWGYRSDRIRDALEAHDYRWFELDPDGRLRPPAPRLDCHGNLVAIPTERLGDLQHLMSSAAAEFRPAG